MIILKEPIKLSDLPSLEPEMFFNDEEMVKAVSDNEKGLIALNAPLHSDLENLLLENGSSQKSLYGFNIYFDKEIEYDSLINPPRNRADGFPRVGRYVASPDARDRIKEIVDKWIID